ncbi:MAG: hypothetical protein M1818_005351 [Claussenomyces sp. TS43310]|nr:MAG: hypothetical protein M1818_005351 [Claussenomyces sp. TS43310]
MPVELRKRKPVEPAPAPPAKKKNPVAQAAEKVKAAVTGGSQTSKANGAAAAPSKVAVGDVISLDAFGGEVETNDGNKTTLKELAEESKAGVILFTYPKASTPGCTTQACLFRDSYTALTATGYSIFGLSTDSPKANNTFKTKQNLPYPLLCDPSATLIGAIGLKKAPRGTTRGLFVIDKTGKVLAAEPGSPAGTVEVVKKLIGSAAPISKDVGSVNDGETKQTDDANGSAEAKDDVAKAEVAADVADTAEKLDSNEAAP